MFWIFKNKTLEAHFNGLRSVKISGVKFKIKKLDALDHLQGLNVLQKIHDTYKVGKDAPANPEVTLESINKIKKYCRDIILGGVVSPKLAAADGQDGFPVDKIISDLAMAQALAKAILTYTYKKK